METNKLRLCLHPGGAEPQGGPISAEQMLLKSPLPAKGLAYKTEVFTAGFKL